MKARPRTASHIVAILPRGEAIRNFVQSGALDTVRSASNLTLISVVPDRSTIEDLETRYQRVVPLEEDRERYPVRILRDLLDMAHGRNLWSAAARERWRLRDAEANTSMKRLKRWGKKAVTLPFSNRRGVELLERCERRASRALRISDRYTELFRSLKPTLVFNGSHVHSVVAIQAVQAAQWLGVKSCTFIFSWDNLTSQGRILPPYDYYLVWNEELKRQLIEIYPAIRPDHVFVTGTPQFDFHFDTNTYWSREEFCRKVGADPVRPIVLYSTGMPNHMPGEPLIVEQIADFLAEMTDLGPPQLLVRVYPKDRTGRFDELAARRPEILFPPSRWVDNWLTPTEDDNRMLTNTLRHAEAGINVASTISLELCMFDKPVLNVGYNPPGIDRVRVPYSRYYEYDHYRRLVQSGAVDVAWTSDEMKRMLRDALMNPSSRSAERQEMLRRMFADTLDGRSHQRVAETLLTLAAV